MLEKRIVPVSWGIGLSAEEQQNLLGCFGHEMKLATWEATTLPTLQDMEKNQPCILWLSQNAYETLQNLPSTSIRHLDLLPKILLLAKDAALEDLEVANENGIAEIVYQPFTKKRLQRAMNKILEAQEVHHSILCMTKEIMLEREILERKNKVLSFLVNFLTGVSTANTIPTILNAAKESLNILFNVNKLSAVLWTSSNLSQNFHAEAYIAALPESASFANIEQELHNLAQAHLGKHCKLSIFPMEAETYTNEDLDSTKENVWSIPITVGSSTIGFLLLTTNLEESLGRDQALALSSAMAHLGFCLQTAQDLKTMEQHATVDSLTQIYNRRHFDSYIDLELERFERYGHPMALLMFDIDHFKHINDTYGHQTGDIILREVAEITTKTIRKSDYCARYGGEEFVVILSHVKREKAMQLAERLRANIEKQAFGGSGNNIHVTISIGLTCLEEQNSINKIDLIRYADSALYTAKKRGRNCVQETPVSQKPKLLAING